MRREAPGPRESYVRHSSNRLGSPGSRALDSLQQLPDQGSFLFAVPGGSQPVAQGLQPQGQGEERPVPGTREVLCGEGIKSYCLLEVFCRKAAKDGGTTLKQGEKRELRVLIPDLPTWPSQGEF